MVDAIISQGLEFRIAQDGFFGKGIYLAESMSKADQYAGGKPGVLFSFFAVQIEKLVGGG